jgi:hypothetical protein
LIVGHWLLAIGHFDCGGCMTAPSKRRPNWLLVTGTVFGALIGAIMFSVPNGGQSQGWCSLIGAGVGFVLGVAADIWFSYMRWGRD